MIRFLLSLVVALTVSSGAGATEHAGAPFLAFSAEVGGNTDVYIARTDGTDRQRLTTSPGADFDPSWSPDHTQVAYRCQVDTTSDICVVPLDGSGPHDITQWPGDEWSPAWSPDGRWIAFFSDHTDLGSLWVIHPDGTNAYRLVGGAEYPSWSPDGKRIAYSDMATRDLAVIRADGTHKHLIARNDAYDGSPSFSPAGHRIAFDSQRGFKRVQERGIGPEFEIYSVGSNGRRVRRLTRNHVEDRFPDYGPGGRIVYSEGGRLWIVGRHGGHRHRLPLRGTFPDW